MQIRDLDEHRLLGGALVALGLSLGGAAAAVGLLAADHMAEAALLCGPTTGHCIRCFAAAALLMTSLGAVAAGSRRLRPIPASQRAG